MRTLAVLLPFCAPLTAQGLDLTVHGGPIPGQITWELSGGTPALQGGVILLGLTAGPTPLALTHPFDPRFLHVGTELLEASQAGAFDAAGRFAPPPVPVPNMPGLVDAPLFFQGVSVPGGTYLVDRISLPRVVRFGLAGTWRDRFVALTQPLQFMTVLPTSDQRTLIAGGSTGAIFAQLAVRTTDVYDPLTDAVTNGPTMNTERSMHTATRLRDGRWLLVGGVDGQNDPQTAAEVWNPATETFTPVAPMRTPRMGHAAVLLQDGRVFVSGGLTDMTATSSQIDPIFSTTRSTEIYDPATDRWVQGPDMRFPRAGHAGFVRGDGRVLLAGGLGFRRILIDIPVIEDTSDLFDPSNGTLTAGPRLSHARAVSSQVEIAPGRWLLAGGVGTISLTQWGTLTDTAEIYDESANTFTATGSMAQRRGLHAVHALGGNRFLHIGGADGTLFALTALSSTEIYDAGTGTWTPGPSLTQPRAAFASFVTDTGPIMLLGGTVAQNNVTNRTEFYFR